MLKHYFSVTITILFAALFVNPAMADMNIAKHVKNTSHDRVVENKEDTSKKKPAYCITGHVKKCGC